MTEIKPNVEGKNLTECPLCRQKALVLEPNFCNCAFCGNIYDDESEKLITDYTENILNLGLYFCQTQGVDYPVYDCLHGCDGKMIAGLSSYFCVDCGDVIAPSNISYCSDCQEPKYKSEINVDLADPLCDTCYEIAFERFE